MDRNDSTMCPMAYFCIRDIADLGCTTCTTSTSSFPLLPIIFLYVCACVYIYIYIYVSCVCVLYVLMRWKHPQARIMAMRHNSQGHVPVVQKWILPQDSI